MRFRTPTSSEASGLHMALNANDAQEEFRPPYVNDLRNGRSIWSKSAAEPKAPVDRSAVPPCTMEPIKHRLQTGYRLVNPTVDPTFSFMTVTTMRDTHGLLQPYGWPARRLKDRYQVAFANDTDFRSARIVTPSRLITPITIYRWRSFTCWRIGRTGGTAAKARPCQQQHDHRVVHKMGRRLSEVPVGFKCLCRVFSKARAALAQESAGASFLRHDAVCGRPTRRPIMDLLAAEITARSGKDPASTTAR